MHELDPRSNGPLMADLAFVATIVLFFVICTAFIRGLDRIVRATEEVELRHEGPAQ